MQAQLSYNHDSEGLYHGSTVTTASMPIYAQVSYEHRHDGLYVDTPTTIIRPRHDGLYIDVSKTIMWPPETTASKQM